jgi:methionyl-tRNA formyltransferase
MNEKISFVFFGSGPVAAESLRQLKELFSVEAVITKTSTRHEMAEACPAAPLFCVNNKAELDTLIAEQKFKSSCGVLIDFGIIVSNQVIDSFPRGIVNSHFSLLPELRGADPISFALLEGKKTTGVSLMLLVEKMDEGPLIGVGTCDVDGKDTTTTLTEKLIALSTGLLNEHLANYLSGVLLPRPQEAVARENGFNDTASYTRKLTKEDGRIDWNKTAVQIEREIRAYAGWPKSYTSLNGIEIVITDADTSAETMTTAEPGIYEVVTKQHGLRVACGEGYIWIRALKPAGKKEMTIEAFLAGYRSRL